MKKIFYSLPGEGLGHAARTSAILEHLDPSIEVHLFTWGEAYDFFEKQNYPRLYKVPGLPFGRDAQNKIHIRKSFGKAFDFAKAYRKGLKFVLDKAKEEQPDLFISDFEPLIPRVAKKFGKPLLSIDNQHKFSRCCSKDLPLRLRMYAIGMGTYTEWLVPNPDFALISTFYHSATKKYGDTTMLTNCFMRKSFEQYSPIDGDYILVYYKVSCGSQILNMLSAAEWGRFRKVKVYNCPEDKKIHQNGFEYHKIQNESFVKDLAGCGLLFCSSGNQLLGEAVYYGKPVFAIPEPNQPEQEINAHYIEKLKYGVKCDLTDLTLEKVQSFINDFKSKDGIGVNGVYLALKIINKYLEETNETTAKNSLSLHI